MALDLVFIGETFTGTSTATGTYNASYSSANFTALWNPNGYFYNAGSALLSLPAGNYIYVPEGWLLCSTSTFNQANVGINVGGVNNFAGGQMGNGSSSIKISGRKAFTLTGSTNVYPIHQTFTAISGSTISLNRWYFEIYKYS